MKCTTRYCRKKAGNKMKICWRCYWHKLKESDPVKYTYRYVKNNAYRRRKEWGLTLDQFREFCEKHGYIKKKGKQRLSMSIDRIDNKRGYFADNIRPLTLGLNSSKGDSDEYPF